MTSIISTIRIFHVPRHEIGTPIFHLEFVADSLNLKRRRDKTYISCSYSCLSSPESKVSPQYNQFYWPTEPLVSTTSSHLKLGTRAKVPKYRTSHPESIWMNLVHKRPQIIIRKLCMLYRHAWCHIILSMIHSSPNCKDGQDCTQTRNGPVPATLKIKVLKMDGKRARRNLWVPGSLNHYARRTQLGGTLYY